MNTIAVDAMGGDSAPVEIVKGAIKAKENGIHYGFLYSTFYELFCANCNFYIPLELKKSSLFFMLIN